MKPPAYTPLTEHERALLHDPRAEAAREEWQNAVGALSGLVALLSETYPRPLHLENAADEWAAADESLGHLRGTPFHGQVLSNVRAAREIWELWEREGHTHAVHQLADSYLDALAGDSLAMRYYPETPSVHVSAPPQWHPRAAV